MICDKRVITYAMVITDGLSVVRHAGSHYRGFYVQSSEFRKQIEDSWKAFSPVKSFNALSPLARSTKRLNEVGIDQGAIEIEQNRFNSPHNWKCSCASNAE